ncbi:MAG: hypothetical protein C0483_15315 [Pirellula sp.]|nr:hypothetical protein [Pirellula sp.]
MNTGGPIPWGQLLIPAVAAAAILSFYFLKVRRKPVLVPSTFLWRRTIQDHRVNALWQRLRKSILLLLQLLAVLLAAVALVRPTWSGSVLRGGRYVFLIDNSASMSATDVAPSRLEEAKRRVLTLIDRMGSGDAAMVVSFSDQARINQAFTENREQLRRAVREIAPTNRPTSLDEALRICLRQGATTTGADDGAAAPAAPEMPQLFIVSDGRFTPPADLATQGLRATFLPVGEAASNNLAVLGFAVERSNSGSSAAQALAKVRNFTTEPRTVELELRIGDRLIDARRVALEAGQQKDILFQVADAADGLWQLKLPHADVLPADDIAWAVLAPPRTTRGLVVTAGNRYLEAALATDEAKHWTKARFESPRFLKTSDYQASVEAGAWDWILFDNCRPPTSPTCSTLYLGALPPGDDWRSAAKIDLPQIIDVVRTHPLFENVALGEVLLAEAVPPVGPLGTQTLVESDRGPLASIAPRGAYEDLVLGFSLASADGTPLTNWPLVDGAGFEQFVLNVVQYFGRARSGAAAPSIRPGRPYRFRLEGAASEARVVAPDGTATLVKRADSGDFAYYDASLVGPYGIEVDGRPRQTFCVNLFDAAESQTGLGEQPALKIGEFEIAGKQQWETTRLEGWRPFLLVMLALLLVEWYIYGRRAGR